MAHPVTAVTELLLPAATDRFILLANHVLSGAPAAMQRLKPHAGRRLRIEVDNWRIPLPPPPPLTLRVTPAGLFEAADSTVAGGVADATAPELRLRLDAARPVEAARRMATGELPPLQIEGDVAFAADVSWVVANVRWDIGADLERVFGPLLAGGLSQLGDRLAQTARGLADGAASVLRKA